MLYLIPLNQIILLAYTEIFARHLKVLCRLQNNIKTGQKIKATMQDLVKLLDILNCLCTLSLQASL